MSPDERAASRERAADPLRRATGSLSTAAMARMEADMAWFRDLAAEDRSWVGLIVQAGIQGFVDWYRDPASPAPRHRRRSAIAARCSAPRRGRWPA